MVLASFGVVGVDGLLERCNVAEGEQEQHHQLALVADRRHVDQQPQRRTCPTALNIYYIVACKYTTP